MSLPAENSKEIIKPYIANTAQFSSKISFFDPDAKINFDLIWKFQILPNYLTGEALNFI